jgi:hypothetical protein
LSWRVYKDSDVLGRKCDDSCHRDDSGPAQSSAQKPPKSVNPYAAYEGLGVTVDFKNAEQSEVAVVGNEGPLLVPSTARKQLSALHFPLRKMCSGFPSGAASTEPVKMEMARAREAYIVSRERGR